MHRDKGKNGPCPCGISSDAFHRYPDGHGYCFSGNCTRTNKRFSNRELEGLVEDKEPIELAPKAGLVSESVKTTYQFIDLRGVSRHIWERYRSPVKVLGETPVEIGFRYSDDLTKVRNLSEKKFFWRGKHKPGLFGKDAFPKGSFTDLIITEGEYDAPSAYQMVGGGKVAAVSVQSSGSAVADITADIEYVLSAQRVFLSFDNDRAGKDAVSAVSTSGVIPFEKLFRVDHGAIKDANDFLVNGRDKEYRAAVSGASKLTPDGVISSYDEVNKVLLKKKAAAVVDFPFSAGEEKLEGLRLGTSVLFSGLEGIGKTEILRKLEHHVLKSTDYNVGIIHLEEGQEDTINNLLTYEVGMPLRKKDVGLPIEEKMKSYGELTKRDNRVFIYSHFGSDNPDDFLGIVRYLVTVAGCRFIFFDHVNFVVTQMNVATDERRTLDYICSRLEKLVEELNFCLIFICHENDDGTTRGSRNISQTAHVRIRLRRDIENDDPVERCKLYMSVAKNRPASSTGPIGWAYFDESLGALVDEQDNYKHDFLPPLEKAA